MLKLVYSVTSECINHYTSLSYQCRYRRYCTVARKPWSECPTKVTNFILQLANQQMRLNNETTAVQLYDILFHHGISISLRTVLRSRQQIGWTFRGSAGMLTKLRASSGHISILTTILLMTFGQMKLLCSSKLTENVAIGRWKSVQSLNLAQSTQLRFMFGQGSARRVPLRSVFLQE